VPSKPIYHQPIGNNAYGPSSTLPVLLLLVIYSLPRAANSLFPKSDEGPAVGSRMGNTCTTVALTPSCRPVDLNETMSRDAGMSDLRCWLRRR
jgi:hypothetical protein